ncbi:MAG: endonuclease/exonuclease/phosphatase family protein [Ferruginibacter sp.]
MKKIVSVLFLLILFKNYLPAQSITVATFNMRYSIENNHVKDSLNGESWRQRGPVVAAMIRFHEMEIIGTQECLLHQLTDLTKWLPQYRYAGIGRDDGKTAGEFSAILYNESRFKVLKQGNFWLSETPDKPSLGWDATCCNRICSWVYFEELKSNKKFYVFNAHFDHQGMIASKESAQLILAKMNVIAGKNPVIFMGDLNGDRNSEWYKQIASSEMLSDSYSHAKDPYENNGSFNGFGKAPTGEAVIDHVFISSQFSVNKWGILTDTYHGNYPSDHFPVMVKLTIK